MQSRTDKGLEQRDKDLELAREQLQVARKGLEDAAKDKDIMPLTCMLTCILIT